MNKVTRLKYYIESLCIYDFEDDDVFSALYDLLCDDEEDTVALQSYFFKELAKSESLKKHISRLILTNDNIFTKAACAGKVGELSIAVMNAVKSDLAKLEEIASLTAQDIIAGVDDEEIKEILIACKLENLADKLDIVDDWSRILSLGEQQRIAFARILLYRPEFVFLDEATSALDEDLEGNLYDMLKIHLPNTKIISIAHRSSLIAKHQAILRLKEKGCWEIHE